MILGYRWWYAAKLGERGWYLKSIARRPPVWWEGPHLVAPVAPRVLWCDCAFEAENERLALQSECGIYAFQNERRAIEFGQVFGARATGFAGDDYPVRGTVGLWGKVVEHEDGYRAEHAMIERLIVPRGILVHSAMGLCAPEVAAVYPASVLMDYDALGRRFGVEVEVGEGIEIVV